MKWNKNNTYISNAVCSNSMKKELNVISISVSIKKNNNKIYIYDNIVLLVSVRVQLYTNKIMHYTIPMFPLCIVHFPCKVTERQTYTTNPIKELRRALCTFLGGPLNNNPYF